MKNMTRKFLAAGLIATALTFVGCKSDKSAEQPADTTQGTGTDTGTTTPTEGTGTGTDPGTGGAGTEDDINKTRQTDDNIRYPREDPLRTPEPESIRDAERETEQGVHDNNAGTGGSGFGNEATNEPMDLGGNIDDTRDSDMPSDVPADDAVTDDNQFPEGAR